jgi:tetratricopeptide (TPR) repeat protein
MAMAKRTRAAREIEEPADCLAAAMRARSSTRRAAWARRGLARAGDEIDPDIQLMLLRQLYLAQLEDEDFDTALSVANQMVHVGTMTDIAFHDRGRVHIARGELRKAIEAQRLASRHAPPQRRSFHTFALAQFQHFAGESEASLRTLERALRWSHQDRPLVRGFRAYVELETDRVPEALEATRRALSASPMREGYGQFVLGMIAWHLGDKRMATVHLRAFLRKNASADKVKAATLREELKRARQVLAETESD